MMSYKYVKGVRPEEGHHRWHYANTRPGASFAITILRYGKNTHCVCVMDTRSNPQAEHDAEVLCAALDAAEVLKAKSEIDFYG